MSKNNKAITSDIENVGLLKVRRVWKEQKNAVRAAENFDEWLLELSKLLLIPKYAVNTVTEYDPTSGKPKTVKPKVDKDSALVNIEIILNYKSYKNEFIKSVSLYSNLKSYYVKIPTTFSLPESQYVLSIRQSDIYVGGDRFEQTFLPGLNVSISTLTKL